MTYEKKWRGFAALVPVVAMSFMDQTILPVALPTIQIELGATSTELQWCVNAYMLAIAVFVLVSVKLSDQIGHKNALLYGITGFAFFSALCGLSVNIWMLILARGCQGLSAAFMFPAQTAMIAKTFPQAVRGRATGLIVSIGSLFMIVAPFIGGYLTESASWRWIFWINLPIAAIGLWMIRSFLPNCESSKAKIDRLGFLYFFFGATATTLIFMQAPVWGWISFETLALVIIAPIALTLLLIREKKTKHPFLDLSLFKLPVYTAINISIVIVQFILMVTVFQTIYFQEILGYSPIQTGTIIAASSFPIIFMAPIAGFLSDRLSPKWPMSIGFSCLIGSFLYLSIFSTPHVIGLIAALTIFGMGIPLIFTPSYSSAISSVPKEKTGVAMGMILTLRYLGGTVGLALIHLFVGVVQERKTSVEGARDATIASFSAIHFGLACLMAIAFFLSFFLHSRKSKHQLPSSPAEGWD
jgi:EmrB/QacA subfamily drug resistance transporter